MHECFQLYWLTLNGTVHMYGLIKQLLSAGFVPQALPSVVFCVKAIESHVIFSTARYLPWRTQLYVTLCNAYMDVKAHDLARLVIKEGKVGMFSRPPVLFAYEYCLHGTCIRPPLSIMLQC